MPEVELPDPEELEERRDKAFSRRVALTTAVYAVILAIASLGGNNAMKEMLLAQQCVRVGDQWTEFLLDDTKHGFGAHGGAAKTQEGHDEDGGQGDESERENGLNPRKHGARSLRESPRKSTRCVDFAAARHLQCAAASPSLPSR